MYVSFIKTKATLYPKIYTLGGVVVIEAVLEEALESGDTINVRIEDMWDRTKVDNLAMTEVTPGVYRYYWQTVVGGITDEAGTYQAFVSVVSDGNTYVDHSMFELVNTMENL